MARMIEHYGHYIVLKYFLSINRRMNLPRLLSYRDHSMVWMNDLPLFFLYVTAANASRDTKNPANIWSHNEHDTNGRQCAITIKFYHD